MYCAFLLRIYVLVWEIGLYSQMPNQAPSSCWAPYCGHCWTAVSQSLCRTR